MSLLLLLRPRRASAVATIVTGRFDSPTPAGGFDTGSPEGGFDPGTPSATTYDPPEPG